MREEKTQNKSIEEIVEEFYSVAPKYRTKARLNKMLTNLTTQIRKEAWVEGFMETCEGYNGEYCGGCGGNEVTKEEVEKIYDEELQTITDTNNTKED